MTGYNVNLLAYGQTGTGKTHTMLGTPGVMKRAGRGDYGTSVHEEYGIFPRAALDIFSRYKHLSSSSKSETYLLTAHSIELSMMLGNQDMLNKKTGNTGVGGLVKATQYIVLTLYCYRPETETVWSSRFQFVDLAGSEKLEEAHGDKDYHASAESFQGMIVNLSLAMLGQAIRALLDARRNRKKFSFRAFLFDLVLLLSESLSGEAFTAVFICVSQAPANAATTFNALDFGKVFSQLKLKKKKVKPVPIKKLVKAATKLFDDAQKALDNNPPAKYKMIRQGQLIDGRQKLQILQRLQGGEGAGGLKKEIGDGGGKKKTKK